MSLVNDQGDQDLPREKFYKFGAASLSNAELMAIFLSSGVTGRNVLQVAQDLLDKYGGLQELGRMPLSEYMNNKGIGLAKACKLAAAFELGIRLSRETYSNIPLDKPELIYELVRPSLSTLPYETLLVITVNSRLEHTSTNTISVGSVNETSAHPREIMRPVITRNAYGFILVHNHPSGDPSPSMADQKITSKLVKAADLMQIPMIDHVIVGSSSPSREAFFSFRAAGMLQ